jgi:hypothetical protein
MQQLQAGEGPRRGSCVHASNILRKLGAKRRVDATGIAHKMGLLPVH